MSKINLTIGIQGGKGSFNEEAVLGHLQRTKQKDFKLTYLHTTENVLRELSKGTIDQGQFAVHNTLGGLVDESIIAMGKYHFELIDSYKIKIAHALMVKKGTDLKDVTTIMTHPQVLSQCKDTLAKKYKHLKQTSGEGEMIDHARVAKAISEGELDPTYATIGSKVLAEICDLDIVEYNLQDLNENHTSFVLVKKL